MSCGHNRSSIKVGNFSYLSFQPVRNLLLYKTVSYNLKMKKILILIVAAFFASCNDKIDLSQFTGTWIENESREMFEPNRTREITFFDNGTYQNRIYDKKGSLIDKFDGTFEINKEVNKIIITNSGYKLKDMNLTKLTEHELKVTLIEQLEEIEELEITTELHYIKK